MCYYQLNDSLFVLSISNSEGHSLRSLTSLSEQIFNLGFKGFRASYWCCSRHHENHFPVLFSFFPPQQFFKQAYQKWLKNEKGFRFMLMCKVAYWILVVTHNPSKALTLQTILPGRPTAVIVKPLVQNWSPDDRRSHSYFFDQVCKTLVGLLSWFWIRGSRRSFRQQRHETFFSGFNAVV